MSMMVSEFWAFLKSWDIKHRNFLVVKINRGKIDLILLNSFTLKIG